MKTVHKVVWTNPAITLFHGTLEEHVDSIVTKIDIRKCDSDSDFGQGFYTTTSLEQAKIFARKVKGESEKSNAKGVVIQFSASRDELARLDSLWFVRFAPDAVDFWTLIESCRASGSSNRSNDAWYDLVVGPVAKWYQTKKIYDDYDQISFHTDKATKILDTSNKEVVFSC